MATPTLPRARTGLLVNLALAVVVALVATILVSSLLDRPASGSAVMPQDPAMENAIGVRFSRVAVVGDGGLVTVFYVVLDPEKATAFQADREHPPVLRSEARDGGTQRASIMRAGHQMRAGQTYYFVYENVGGALRSGELASISYGGLTLRHVPVL